MKVILTEKVQSLGNVGEIIDVSPGYARNYLIPRKLVVINDIHNKKQMNHCKKILAQKISQELQVATELKKKIDGLTLDLIKTVGTKGKLFGAVTNNDISIELKKQNIFIERRLIVLGQPIKTLGLFDIKAKLFTGTEALFKINVTMDKKQEKEMRARNLEESKNKIKKKDQTLKGSEEKEKSLSEMTEEERLKREADQILK